MQRNKVKLILFYLFSVLPLLYCQPESITIDLSSLQEIPRLSSYEPAFKEYSKLVEKNHKLLIQKKQPETVFYKYTNTEKFTLQGLAARCNISYDTLATLNQLESSSETIAGKTLVLPSVSGLFIPVEKGKSSIEILLQENYSIENLTNNDLYYNINDRNYLFLLNQRFSSTERAFFLDSALQLPLPSDTFWVSSEFGKRKNPFSGKMKNHNGIDLAAAEGTPVYAIKDGAVSVCLNNDPEFGNYLIISHDQGKLTSVYAHLQEVLVEQYQNVKKGDLVGYVGKTGMATGPHLHFEIRQGGKAEDPRLKLNLK